MRPRTHVWYVSYGSNMAADRFACYVAGGRPPGGTRTNPGARDSSMPRRSIAVDLPGTVYFAGESPQWGGGVAFYDHETPGGAAARGYLVTTSQFADVAAQEMYREPGADLDLTAVLTHGRHALGPGRYETLLHLGEHDGRPALTFTAPWSAADVEHTAPSAAYLKMLAAGLSESHHWTAARIADYLARRTPFWTAADVEALVSPSARPR
jgi:hypothetical protein